MTYSLDPTFVAKVFLFITYSYRKSLFHGQWNPWIGPSMKIGTPRNHTENRYFMAMESMDWTLDENWYTTKSYRKWLFHGK